MKVKYAAMYRHHRPGFVFHVLVRMRQPVTNHVCRDRSFWL